MGTTTYRDMEKIGSGGLGEVWKTRNMTDNSLWAIKRLKKDATPEDKDRLAREVRMQSQLSHPHIARIVATGFCRSHTRGFPVAMLRTSAR
jgi:serine/threonine protein kinase